MKRVSVNSSNIASIGYESSTQTLEVEFHSGGIYEYYNVPSHVYTALMNATSHGGYLAKNIKGHYKFSEL